MIDGFITNQSVQILTPEAKQEFIEYMEERIRQQRIFSAIAREQAKYIILK